MNKKQLTVGWIVTAILCAVIIFAPQKHIMHRAGHVLSYDAPIYWNESNPAKGYQTIPKIQWDFVFQRALIALLVGGFLIYTCRDKKK